MNIIDKIKENKKEVLSGKIPDNLQICPKCNVNAENIKLHERRKRLFLVITERFIRKVWTLPGRWKCHCCNSTFTYYPQFAIPHKRYVNENIMSLSRQYVEDDRSTYRNVVRYRGLAIGYEIDKDKIDERLFVGTTLWRWLGFIGSLENTLRDALDLIRQKSPTSEIFREAPPLNPRKYRSEERRKLLQRCMELFNVENEFKNVLGFQFSHT